MRARRLNPFADALDVMGGQVIHHHDVAGLERRDQDLIEIGQKRVTIHRPIEQAWRGESGNPQRRHERAGLPVMMRCVIVDARAAAAPAVAPQQIRGDPALIEKHEPGGVHRGGEAAPVRPGRRHVGAMLLGRAYGFF